MREVLFSFVGKRDPMPLEDKDSGEGAVVTLAREVKPDKIVLFVTYDPNRKGEEDSILHNLEDTISWLDSDNIIAKSEIDTIKLKAKDPRDYETLLPRIRESMDEYYNFNDKDKQISHINLSSGTPQQETAFLLLVENGYFPNHNLYQVSEPRYIAGKQSRCKKIKPTFIREENLIRAASHHLNSLEFKLAHEQLSKIKDITIYSKRKSLSKFYTELCIVYDKWSQLKYKEAYDRMKRLYREHKDLQELQEVTNIIEAQYELLKGLRAEKVKETKENLLDLYHNARRAYKKGEYTDTLARFWRLGEGILFYQLREKYGIEPGNLDLSTDKDNLAKVRDEIGEKYDYINFSKAREVMDNVFKDEILNRLKGINLKVPRGASSKNATYSQVRAIEEFKKLRNARNKSMAAHGMKPVSWYEAKSSVLTADKFLQEFGVKGEADEEYPFSCESIAAVAEEIKAI